MGITLAGRAILHVTNATEQDHGIMGRGGHQHRNTSVQPSRDPSNTAVPPEAKNFT